ncbi:hypothetical protein ACF3NR_06410 [Vaginella massiliensis]|uniref:hypothetical protein n=1 Tax=Flavobacteriales TaxID=200644 RepID=UPI0025549C4F|nr:hypothetical protein [Weeksella virosa]MDK7674250.1 hypothetical protein [Weeksella virosa]
MQSILAIVRQNISFLILVLGSGSYFVTNLVLKSVFNEFDYGAYSLLVTYFSLLYLFCILGLEQVFIRFSYVEQKNKIITDSLIIRTVGILSVVISCLSATLFYRVYDIIPSFTLFLLSSLGISFSMITFTITRLNEDFTFSQFLSNYWKIFLLIFSSLALIGFSLNYQDLFYYLCATIIIVFAILFLFVWKRIKITTQKTIAKATFYQMFFQYFVSIMIFCFLNFFDRFIIENHFGIEELGNYFFLNNFFLAPFLLLQNYFGFKQLVKYKNNFSLKLLRKNILTSVFFGLALCVFLLMLSFIIQQLNLVPIHLAENWQIIVLFLLIGIVRISSSMSSAAFELLIELKYLKLFNLVFILVLGIFFTFLMIRKITIPIILLIFLGLWLIRFSTQLLFISKSYKSTQP